MFSRKLLATALLAVLSCGLSFQAKAVDLVNGDFEETAVGQTLGNEYLNNGTTGVFGWTTSGPVYHVDGTPTPSVLNYFDAVSLPGNTSKFALLSTFDYSPDSIGSHATMESSEFNLGGNSDILFRAFLYTDGFESGITTKAIAYLSKKDGDTWTMVDSSPNWVFNASNASGFLTGSANNPWIDQGFSFTGVGTYKLTFDLDTNRSNYATFFGVDNVRVVPVPAAAWTGLALLGLFPLRRKLMGR